MTSIVFLVVRFFYVLKSEKVHNQTLGAGNPQDGKVSPRWEGVSRVFTGLCKKVRTLEELAFLKLDF